MPRALIAGLSASYSVDAAPPFQDSKKSSKRQKPMQLWAFSLYVFSLWVAPTGRTKRKRRESILAPSENCSSSRFLLLSNSLARKSLPGRPAYRLICRTRYRLEPGRRRSPELEPSPDWAVDDLNVSAAPKISLCNRSRS